MCAVGAAVFYAVYLLYSQSILSDAFHDLAGWEPAGYSRIMR